MPEPPVASPTAEKYLRLHLCKEVGAIRFAALLQAFGDIDTVLGTGISQLVRVKGIRPKVAENIARSRDATTVSAELELARERGVRILCLADEEYPPALRHINDPPPCLYVRGSLQATDTVALAIVGSRYCSRYGSEQAERFGALTANAGLTVVSGMARGIDSCAHRGALAMGGRTIAVMGCGLCHLYPPESKDLAGQIIKSGAILSALPMEIAPDAKNFPPRNRIIAGLSLGVLVVEAARRSGALITARLAGEYNREAFALPGRIDTAHAEGCHELIKTGGAKLVTRLSDILEELGETGAVLMSQDRSETLPDDPPRKTIASLDSFEQRVFDSFGAEPLSVDALCEIVDLPPARIAAALTGLQLKGAVRNAGGDGYQRIAGKPAQAGA